MSGATTASTRSLWSSTWTRRASDATDQFMPYPLEGPQDGDLVCRATAAEALPALVNLLKQQAG